MIGACMYSKNSNESTGKGSEMESNFSPVRSNGDRNIFLHISGIYPKGYPMKTVGGNKGGL